ncbi:MAG TPA: GDP-L-fucose synthase, partial [Desulfurivibrionaceae bacterium]|nr:GDP-L-fucose synthase [Desulfurivibrionaceae bacterium]
AERPEFVFLAAAKVGGIYANQTYPAEFIQQNLAIQNNIIHASYLNRVKRLLFLGSSCIYPKLAPQPMREEDLLSGPLEPSNEAYAIAKIAGIKMCEAYNRQFGTAYLAVMPTNLYGPGDNFDLENSHVLPALLRKFHEAKLKKAPSVTVWGSGTPRREFLHVDDLADCCLHLMNLADDRFLALTRDLHPTIINIGVGEDLAIRELAEIIKQVVEYRGQMVFDAGKPDGTPRKLLDLGRLRELGWQARIPLREGIAQTYRWYLQSTGDKA